LRFEANTEDKKLVEKLTTICHGDVWMAPKLPDDTKICLMWGLKITTDSVFQLQRKQLMLEKHQTTTESEGLQAISSLPVPHLNLKYAHKTHYRIVFKKSITIDLILSLPDIMTILTGTVAGETLSCNVLYLSQV
jgi:hypothetical protein